MARVRRRRKGGGEATRSARGRRRVYPRALSHRDRFNEKNPRGPAQKSDPGETRVLPPEYSACVLFAARGLLRHPRVSFFLLSVCSQVFITPPPWPPPPPLPSVLRYAVIGIACSASSLTASFDPLNLAGDRPTVSLSRESSREKPDVPELREGGLSPSPELFQTFLSFPHAVS